jgi:predicted SAM-dependent methyltransferase
MGSTLADHEDSVKLSCEDEPVISRRLNIGCGQRYCSGWTNIDYVGSEDVLAHDLRKGLPFPDESFDVVYHSHVLEHISKQDAGAFMKECFRVLKQNGILRVVVPDLELLVRNYLCKLEEVRRGSVNEYVNYEWTVIHLLDQLVRTYSGGEMAKFIKNRDDLDLTYVIDTCGDEVAEIVRKARINNNKGYASNTGSSTTNLCSYLKAAIRNYLKIFGNKLQKMGSSQDNELERQIAFRNSGEVHQWMYDEISLKNLLVDCDFTNICLKSASESSIRDWSSFNLDTSEDGSIFHTDSLFMEASR